MRRNVDRTLAIISALLLVACNAAEETDEPDTGTAEGSTTEEVDEPEGDGSADGALEGADAEEEGAEAPDDPDGFVRVDGEEHPLTLALNCEPRESSTLMDPRSPGSEVDGMIEFRTMVLGADEFAIDVWEQTTDGVRAQRLFSENLLGPERSIVAESDGEFPLFEVEGNQVIVEAQHPVDADEVAEVYAEWTFPDEYSNC